MSSGANIKPGFGRIGCGPFYLVGQGLSLVNAAVSRRRSVGNAHLDAEFEKEMRERKEDYADKKSERDLAFSRAKYELKRQFRREEAKAKLINDLEADELKMFFGDWPLALDIHSILNNPATFSDRMNFILARKAAARSGDSEYSTKPLAIAFTANATPIEVGAGFWSVGADAISGNASIVTIFTTAIMCLVISFFGPFVTFLATIPSVVMGGVCITLYGFIAVSGLKMIQKVDLGENKNLFVVSVILIAGIGGMTLKIFSVTLTEIACALILGIITNLILSRKQDEEVAAA